MTENLRTSSRVREIEDRAKREARQREDELYSSVLAFLRAEGNVDEDNREIKDFVLPVEIIPFPPPRDEEDFTIPDDWKPKVALNYKPFKLITQNSYRGIATKPTIDEQPICACSKEQGCNHQCQNRILFMECAVGMCSSINNGEKFCANTVIQRRAFPGTEVFMSRNCGFGLRATEDIPPDTIVIEYLGQVVTSDEGKERMSRYKSSDDFYFMSLGNGLMLDAKPMGSNARFANHCCDPNCELQKWNVLGETRLVIVSKKSIMNGDEITYNYQYFDDDLGDIPRQICSCGTSICSGTIGGRVVSSEEQKWLDRATVLLTGSKRYPLDVIRKHLEQYSDLVQVLNSKKKADRDAKIATTKRQNKRKRAESEAVNFSDISEESIFEPQEYKQLKSLLFRCDEWRTEARLYLYPEQGHYKRTLKVPALQKLLYRAPSEVKIDEYLEIKSMIERCQRLEKRDGLSNSSVLRKAFSVTRLSEPSHDNLLDESLVLKVGKNDSEKDELKTTYNILWDNFISDIKECRAIAPAFCATGVRVLQIYQSACVWANKYLIPYYLDGFISHKKDLSEYMKLVSEGKSTKDVKHLIGHLSLTLWPAIKELGLLYKISVQPDFLILCDILEENLQNYMTRIEYMNEVVNLDRPVFSDASGFSDSASEINTTPSVLKKNTRKAIDDDYDPKKLFCFCWLPESACETESLIQCDNCFEWFHLPCVNMKERCSRGKGRRKFSEYFFCPLCKFDAKEPPEYLFPIKSEWLTSNALSNAYSVKMDEVIVKSEVTAALSNDKLNTTTLSEVTVVKPLNCKMATKTKSGAEKWVDLSYLLELKSVHIGELCIQDSPVWFLLNLAKKYSDEWVSLADTTILTFSRSAYDSSLSETTSPRLSLVKFLRLYYQCRVLRIRPSQIDTVRRIIWDICFDRLFSLGQDKELKSSTCPLGIEEISEILNCGTDLYQNENSDTRINDYRLLALGAFVENAERLINQASIFPSCPPSHNDKCNGYFESITKMFWSDQSVEDIREKWKDDSSKLFSSIDSLSLVLNLTASYPIVRFKSIHCKINQYVTGSENDGKVYCWCRKPDDGSSMVCCDECDFWYHSACVNYVDNKRVRKKKLILHPDASETHCDPPTDEQRDDGYVCIACCDLSGKDYKYMF